MVLCLVAPVKRLSVHHHSVHCIFWSFGMIELIVNHFENIVPLKPVLGGVAGVAHFITGHEQIQ